MDIGHETPDFVPNAAVGRQNFPFRACGFGQQRGIIESMVKDGTPFRENGTAFVGVVADGDHKIEGDFQQIPDQFGTMSGDVHSGLIHDQDRPLVESMRFHAGGPGLHGIPQQGTGPSFSHLASTGVPCAQEKDLQFFRIRRHGDPLILVSGAGACQAATCQITGGPAGLEVEAAGHAVDVQQFPGQE